MLDADNLPLVNPEHLFTSREYTQTGALFFPDWWDAHAWLKPAAYTLFGLTPPWLQGEGAGFKTSESGQMLFNRCAQQNWPGTGCIRVHAYLLACCIVLRARCYERHSAAPLLHADFS